jgi:hypothetical protein
MRRISVCFRTLGASALHRTLSWIMLPVFSDLQYAGESRLSWGAVQYRGGAPAAAVCSRSVVNRSVVPRGSLRACRQSCSLACASGRLFPLRAPRCPSNAVSANARIARIARIASPLKAQADPIQLQG